MGNIEIHELKVDIFFEQDGKCFVCGKRIPFHQSQMAHRVPQHKKYIKKYGKQVIHHRLNIRITCAKCNSAVLLDPATHPIEAADLVGEIRRELGI